VDRSTMLTFILHHVLLSVPGISNDDEGNPFQDKLFVSSFSPALLHSMVQLQAGHLTRTQGQML